MMDKLYLKEEQRAIHVYEFEKAMEEMRFEVPFEDEVYYFDKQTMQYRRVK